MTMSRAARLLGPFALFTALTVFMTWPQALHLGSQATQHQDVFFNMWRLRWIAHALVTRAPLFDGNIFFPEHDTLALSDAMLFEGLAASPLLWAGLPPVLVHNIMMFAGMALSALGMYALVCYLTRSRGAAVLAAIVFAFAPYRFEHVMHMELQWAMWSPLAFLALHRACDTGRLRDGLAMGACAALQMLSSIYYGIFLLTFLALAAVLLSARDRAAPLSNVTKALGAGLALALTISALYGLPYARVHRQVGDRSAQELAAFSAAPADYLKPTPNNLLYGDGKARGRPERHLFPGLTAAALALVAVLLQVPRRREIAYLLLLVAAFEASLGSSGYIFSFLHDYVPLYRGLRAAARLGLFVQLFLGVLAGYGYRALADGRSPRVRAILAASLAVALVAEYRVRPSLVDFANTPSPVYRVLASQPPGVVAEFPIPTVDHLPGPDPEYAYMSTFHWFPLVNGYSGVYPPSYLARLERLRAFPAQGAVVQLRRDNVRYVILHGDGYAENTFAALRAGVAESGACAELGSWRSPRGSSDVLYRCP